MAEVIGPCGSKPGAHHAVPKGTMCDDHPGRPASHRVQGETDSFGAELHDLCLECYEVHKKNWAAYVEEIAVGGCDWCKQPATDLRQHRDFEEGSGGPLYMVCGACRKRESDRCTEELEASGYFDSYDDYDPTDDSWYDGDDEPEPLEELAEDEFEGPELPVGASPPAGFPKAYVDGVFIF